MNVPSTTDFCGCLDCPGAGCTCGCNGATGPSTPLDAALACACGPSCRCNAAGQGCACTARRD